MVSIKLKAQVAAAQEAAQVPLQRGNEPPDSKPLGGWITLLDLALVSSLRSGRALEQAKALGRATEAS